METPRPKVPKQAADRDAEADLDLDLAMYEMNTQEEAHTTVEGQAETTGLETAPADEALRTPNSLLGLVRAAPQALKQRTADPYAEVDGLIRDHLVHELHSYPRKKKVVAYGLWFFTGIAGGHRYYLSQVGLALLMTLTLGGMGIWWIIDAFRLKGMVQAYNAQQAERQANGAPPLGMEFVPTVAPDVLGALPEWHSHRTKGRIWGRKALGLLADGFMIAFCGFVLGQFTLATGTYNAVWAAVVVILMVNFADLFFKWHDVPGVREMIRWDYRLRLFYHFNEPGRAYKLFFRPLVCLFYAPFSKKARTEVILYLEIAGLFAAASILVKLFSGELFRILATFDPSPLLNDWIKAAMLSFFAVYALASPIGATLMKHTLLRRPNFVRWGLSLVAVWFLLTGLEIF